MLARRAAPWVVALPLLFAPLAAADDLAPERALLLGHPAVVSINWWGLSDRNSWLPGGGLLDEEDRPKPVYERLRHLIREEWTTRLDTRTDAEGRLSFRGYFGDYDLIVTPRDGRPRILPVSVRSDEENRRAFTLER